MNDRLSISCRLQCMVCGLASLQVVCLFGCCNAAQTPTHLALVFDIMLGGSLQFYLKKNGRFSLDQARFYAAEVWLVGLCELMRFLCVCTLCVLCVCLPACPLPTVLIHFCLLRPIVVCIHRSHSVSSICRTMGLSTVT